MAMMANEIQVHEHKKKMLAIDVEDDSDGLYWTTEEVAPVINQSKQWVVANRHRIIGAIRVGRFWRI